MVLDPSVTARSESPRHPGLGQPIAVDDSVGGESSSSSDSFLERIVLWATDRFGADQVVTAKEEFYWKTGKVFPDDSFFNSRMAYFLDFFLFQRLLEVPSEQYRGLTPYEAYASLAGDDEGSLLISGFCHSLFEVTKVGDDKLTVVDLLAKEKKHIWRQEHESFDGIGKKDLFQGFVYLIDTRYVLSRGLVFHPKRAHRLIRKFIKQAMKSDDFQPAAALSRLAKIELRHKRHAHVDSKQIYSEDPR